MPPTTIREPTLGTSSLTQLLIQWLNAENSPNGMPLCDYERIRYELKPCDVILVEGRSRVSNVIRLITASPWTHAALYVGRLHDIEDKTLRDTVAQHFPCEPDTQIIIESMLGHGTVVSSLSSYKNDHLRICRAKGLGFQDAQQVIRYAVSRLGTEYDVRQIFDLARFLFPWILLPRKWRSSLFHQHVGRSTRTVCSTMIAEAFAFIQFPILPLVKKNHQNNIQLFRRNPKICVPCDFDYSPYFEIIKYPFVDINLTADYRLLPWKGSGALSTDEAELYINVGLNDNAQADQSLPQAEPSTTGEQTSLNRDSEHTESDTPENQPRSETDDRPPIQSENNGNTTAQSEITTGEQDVHEIETEPQEATESKSKQQKLLDIFKKNKT